MHQDEEKPPILRTWNTIYVFVLAMLVVDIVLLSLFTHYFQ